MTLNYLHVLTHTHEVATHKSLRRSLEHVNHYRCSDKRIQRSKLVYHRQFYVVTGAVALLDHKVVLICSPHDRWAAFSQLLPQVFILKWTKHNALLRHKMH